MTYINNNYVNLSNITFYQQWYDVRCMVNMLLADNHLTLPLKWQPGNDA